MKIRFRNNFKKCSAEYSRFIIMACIALSAASCNSDFYDIEYSDSALCEKSGGTYNDEKGVCICDEEECKPKKNCVQDESRGKLVCEFSNSEESESCSENETVCRMGVLYQCKDKKLVEIKECESGVCDNNHECAECKNGNTKCIVADLSECRNGKWRLAAVCKAGCADNKSCKPECTDGDTKCSDNKIYKCYNGIWDGFEKCTFGCGINDKECRKNCQNEEKICQTDENGFGEIKKCKDSTFIYDKRCDHDNSCLKDGKQCGNCINGNIKCDDAETGAGILKICREGEYVKKSECADGVSCIGNIKCGVCKKGYKECMIKDGRDFVRTCENGEYAEQQCDKYCDSEKMECSDSCKENTERCIDDEDGKGMMQTCTNGEFVSSDTDNKVDFCKKDNHVVSCTDNKKCGECRNKKDNRCYIDSKTKQDVSVVCSNGILETLNCAAGEYCTSGNTVCKKCENGIKRCIEDENGFGIVQQCVEGKFVNVKGHADDLESQYCRVKGSIVSCKDGEAKCGECLDGKNLCINNTTPAKYDSDRLKICQNGVYITKNCAKGTYCNKDNTECKPYNSEINSDERCVSSDNNAAIMQRVKNKQYEGVNYYCRNKKTLDFLGIMSKDTSCSSDNKCGECLNETGYCQIDDNGNDILTFCQDGKFNTRICKAEYNLYCNPNELDCSVCIDGTKRCINNSDDKGRMQECINGKYVDINDGTCKLWPYYCKNSSRCF